jgi:hypothetical protein
VYWCRSSTSVSAGTVSGSGSSANQRCSNAAAAKPPEPGGVG